MTKLTTPVILLCADFDETITLHDTISLLFELASCSASQQQQLETQYANEVDDFLHRYEANWLCTPPTGRSFDGPGLREFLEGYAAIDRRSVERVAKRRALQGIRHRDIVQAASAVPVRPHCAEMLAAVDEWRVLSANWSNDLVSVVLMHAGIVKDTSETSLIIGNELKVDAQGVTTGEMDVTVQSPLDKARWIEQIRLLDSERQPTVVYVGDSANDLLALLEADVGIWLVSDSSSSSSRLLRQLFKSYGIDDRPMRTYKSLADCVAVTRDNDRSKPVIFTITDWLQLKDFVKQRHYN